MLWLHECPVCFPGSTFIDPLSDDGLLGTGQGLAGIDWRHAICKVWMRDALHQQGRVGLAWNDYLWILSQQPFRGIESQFRLAGIRIHAMALETMLGEDRPDMPGEGNRALSR